MRVLFVSEEMNGAELALKLKEEGCEVKLFIKDPKKKKCFKGMVERTYNWKKELSWVGRDGLILFDEVGYNYGKIQDCLRKHEFNVVGGGEMGDELELNREFGQRIMTDYGMDTIDSYDFNDPEEAIRFIKQNPAEWVLKQDDHDSAMNHVGKCKDGNDVISLLNSYIENETRIGKISLQKKVYGVEIGVGRYFNGNDWVGPIELNIEHKPLMNGDIGPMTPEMGTIMWYESDERNRLFQETLAKVRSYLQEINFKGDIEINCIVNEERACPLEFTTRFGWPATQLQVAIHKTPWKDFLMAIAKGDKIELDYKKGWGVVVTVVTPPYPLRDFDSGLFPEGFEIFFKEDLTEKDKENIHFEEVELKTRNGKKSYFITGHYGYLMFVTSVNESLKVAIKEAYASLNKVIIPRVFYRTDIGVKFMERDRKKLKQWGWI